jgi:uncharacterized membrane protein YoaK (UPF0700 family)
MINRLPGWVWLGSGLLAGIAGMVDAVGMLGIGHHGITHVTGTASTLGIQLSAGRLGFAAPAALLGAFVAGAVVSGVIVGNSHLQLGRRYGVALLTESLLLATAFALLARGVSGGAFLLAAAAGLQNAMASTFSSAIVRTTHVTGIFTDIGSVIGHALRGGPLEKRKLTLLCTIGFGFVLGCGLGAWQFARVGYQTLLMPVVLTGMVGLAYIAYSHRKRMRPDAERDADGTSRIVQKE